VFLLQVMFMIMCIDRLSLLREVDVWRLLMLKDGWHIILNKNE
jgi:hypothetical protein